MQLRAPAKINLSFRIIDRRADGFHEIETLMAPVSLFDEITLHQTGSEEGIKLICDDPQLSVGEDNLAVRAVRAFLNETEIRTGVTIELRKKIPHGAGLGGGSSDAATVLMGLNLMLAAKLPVSQLAGLASEIGSDVPFFAFESAAICRGRGELVAPSPLSRKLRLLLIKPSFGVPTPWAYGRWRDSKELPGVTYCPQKFDGLTFSNDLERPVYEKYLFLARMKMWLLAQAEVGAALLSGSGSTIFAVLRHGAESEEIRTRAKAELDSELWIHECETL